MNENGTVTTDFHYEVFLGHNQADQPRVRRLRGSRFNFAPRRSEFALPNAVLFRDPANAGRRFIPLLLAAVAPN